MKRIQRVLIFALIVIPYRGGAISWNPLAWFSEAEEQKKSDSFVTTALNIVQKEMAPLAQYARQHPQQIVVGSGIVATGICMHSFAKLHAALQKNDAWAHWKRDVCISPTKYDAPITHELLHEIQIRYMKLYAITDFMGPIRSFMEDITTEIGNLQRYAWCARWLQSLGLYCCVDAELVTETDERIERLETLKALCLHWLAKTKLDPVLAQ